jgi:hypothetical protein
MKNYKLKIINGICALRAGSLTACGGKAKTPLQAAKKKS